MLNFIKKIQWKNRFSQQCLEVCSSIGSKFFKSYGERIFDDVGTSLSYNFRQRFPHFVPKFVFILL